MQSQKVFRSFAPWALSINFILQSTFIIWLAVLLSKANFQVLSDDLCEERWSGTLVSSVDQLLLCLCLRKNRNLPFALTRFEKWFCPVKAKVMLTSRSHINSLFRCHKYQTKVWFRLNRNDKMAERISDFSHWVFNFHEGHLRAALHTSWCPQIICIASSFFQRSPPLTASHLWNVSRMDLCGNCLQNEIYKDFSAVINILVVLIFSWVPAKSTPAPDGS